jgi:protein-L-isoaspartate(D-aspartate) O-methyltransferase
MDERAGGDHDGFAAQRRRMVETQLAARGIRDPATLAAMRLVPREEFVPPGLIRKAYDDGALAIGRGQTISQPYMVARMVEALHLTDQGWPWRADPPTVLDVGLGSGYQAAVLAQIGARVIAIERDATLADEAHERLRALGYDVRVVVGDGSAGFPEGAPYGGIVVGAAAPSAPEPLIGQLGDGARLVIPIGPQESQVLTVIRRVGDTTERERLDACVFVPLVGRFGYPG